MEQGYRHPPEPNEVKDLPSGAAGGEFENSRQVKAHPMAKARDTSPAITQSTVRTTRR